MYRSTSPGATAETTGKTTAPIVYNARTPLFKSLNTKKNPHLPEKKKKPPLTTADEKLEFLKKAEEENDEDDDEDMDFKPRKKRPRHSGGVHKGRASGNKLVGKRPSNTATARAKPLKKVNTSDTTITGAASGSSGITVMKVGEDLRSIGTRSTADRSAFTLANEKPDKKKVVEPKSIKDKFQRLIQSWSKKTVKPPDPTGPRRVSTLEARKIRLKQTRKQKRMERCTYCSLVLIVLLRLLTTLEMVWEYEDHYMILEHLKRIRKLNALEILEGDYLTNKVWPLVLFLYFIACCILPILTKKELASACIIWLFIQMLYTGMRCVSLQAFIFHRELFLNKPVIMYTWALHTLLDIISFLIVMLYYYYTANPCMERDRYSNTMLGDYLVNEYIQFMVQSSFIRKKMTIQRATAFQVMTVVRKLKEKYRATGIGPSDAAINKEVRSAIRALEDWKKFPALRIIHAFEAKEKAMKEKLKLRRQRIRDMKDRFQKMMVEVKTNFHKSKGSLLFDMVKYAMDNKHIVLNKQGRPDTRSKNLLALNKARPNKSSINLKVKKTVSNIQKKIPGKPSLHPSSPSPNSGKTDVKTGAAAGDAMNKNYADKRAELRNKMKK